MMMETMDGVGARARGKEYRVSNLRLMGSHEGMDTRDEGMHFRFFFMF